MSANNMKCFHCPDCSKEFSKESVLIKHFKVHSSGKSYKCNVCYNKYSSKRQYNEHKKIHSDKEYSACSICQKQMIRTSFFRKLCDECNLKPKKYLCETCGKAYDSQMGVRSHLQRRSHSMFYQCFRCGLIYQSNTALFVHMSQHPDFVIKIVRTSQEIFREHDISKSSNMESYNLSTFQQSLRKPFMEVSQGKEDGGGKYAKHTSTTAYTSEAVSVKRRKRLPSTRESENSLAGQNMQQDLLVFDDNFLAQYGRLGQDRSVTEDMNMQLSVPGMNNVVLPDGVLGLHDVNQGNIVSQQSIIPHHIVLPQQDGNTHYQVAEEAQQNMMIRSVTQDGISICNKLLSDDNRVVNNSLLTRTGLELDDARLHDANGTQDNSLSFVSDKYQYRNLEQRLTMTHGGATAYDNMRPLGSSVSQECKVTTLKQRQKQHYSKDAELGIVNQEERLIYEKMLGGEGTVEQNGELGQEVRHNMVKAAIKEQKKVTLQHIWASDYCDVLSRGVLVEDEQSLHKMQLSNPEAVQDKDPQKHNSLNCEKSSILDDLRMNSSMKRVSGTKNIIDMWNERKMVEENCIHNRGMKRGSGVQLLNETTSQEEFMPNYRDRIHQPVVQSKDDNHGRQILNDILQTSEVHQQIETQTLLSVTDMKNETTVMNILWLEHKKRQNRAKDIENKEKTKNLCSLKQEEESRLSLSLSQETCNSHQCQLHSDVHDREALCPNKRDLVFSLNEGNLWNRFDENCTNVPVQNSIVTGGVNVEDYINHLMWH